MSIQNHTNPRRPARLGLMAFVAAGLFVASACDNPDTEGRFNEFGDKTADRRGTAEMGTPDGGEQLDFSGRYLLALATTLAPTAPIYIETTVTVDPADFTIDFVFQPLKTDMVDGMPRPDARTAVGPQIVVDDVPLSEEGRFEVDLGMVEVNGDANPISGGDIVATIQLQGFVTSATSFCGSATGDVTAPTMLPLAGSTFGAAIIDVDDINMVTPVSICADPIPNNNMGDMGGGDMGDMGGDMDSPPPSIRCHEGLEGDYDLVFKADLSGERTQITMRLTPAAGMDADPHESPCYTGQLISQEDDTTVVANIDFVDDVNTVLTAFSGDFMIPPGANPALPNGAVADLELRAAQWTSEGACGEITFAIQDPPLSSDGDFFMIRQGSTEFTIDDTDLSNATCSAVIPANPCGMDAWAGTYQFKFITNTTAMLGGEPSVVEFNLETNPLTCLTGNWISLVNGDKLADVALAAPVDPDQIHIEMRNFVIPPNPDNPVVFLQDGGLADVVLDSVMATPGTSFCGTEEVFLLEPATISSDGTFAADQAEPATAECP